jgi:hypothetical protein
LKTSEVLEALSQNYPAPEWCLLTEFQPEPGYSGSQKRVDAVAIYAWPSGKYGHSILGFEIKISRADFLNDKKNPNKFIKTYEHCDYAYYVCPEGLIKIEEVPYNAGLIWVNTDKTLNIIKETFVVKKTTTVNRKFFAAIARRSDTRQHKLDKENMAKEHKRELRDITNKVNLRMSTIKGLKNSFIRMLL